MNKVVQRIDRLSCAHCGRAVDPASYQPISVIDCPHCGAGLTVPAEFDEQYLLLEILGRGATGVVFKALDQKLHRRVAIKLLHPDSFNERNILSLVREARTLARVNHPNIVHIYALGECKGRHYFVMELIAGADLQRRIESAAPLSEIEVIDLAIALAQGLAATASLGLAHGDVKPANILLDETHRPKLIDFGAACHQPRAKDHDVIGSPYYIAPEVAIKQAPDYRSDLYSLGATMFHALIGRPPFVADNVEQTIAARLHQPAPMIRDFRNDVHPALDEVIARCLQRDPELRYESFDALAEALWRVREAVCANPVEQINESEAIEPVASIIADSPTKANQRKPVRALALVGAGMFLAAIIAIVGMFFLNLPNKPDDPSPIQIEPVEAWTPQPVLIDPSRLQPITTIDEASIVPTIEPIEQPVISSPLSSMIEPTIPAPTPNAALSEPNQPADPPVLEIVQATAPTPEHAKRFVILHPRSAESTRGAALEILPDGSVLASGPNRAREIYTITFEQEPMTITAFQVEFLGHNALPGGGPGRGPRGRLGVTEIQIQLGDNAGALQPWTINHVLADQPKAQKDLTHLFDNNPNSAWTLDQSHREPATATLIGDPTNKAADQVVVRIVNTFNIGRFRILATSATAPQSLVAGPPEEPIAAAAPEGYEVFLNAGANADMIIDGRTWRPTKPHQPPRQLFGYHGGAMKYTYDDTAHLLLQTELAGVDELKFDVPQGEYRVTLYFMENRKTVNPGARVFSVYMEDKLLLPRVDLAKNPGWRTPAKKSKRVQVDDGQLNIAFRPADSATRQPIINAVSVQRVK